jgi:hypothetical protein
MSYQTQNPRFIKAFVQAGVLAQGLLQCLAVVAGRGRMARAFGTLQKRTNDVLQTADIFTRY